MDCDYDQFVILDEDLEYGSSYFKKPSLKNPYNNSSSFYYRNDIPTVAYISSDSIYSSCFGSSKSLDDNISNNGVVTPFYTVVSYGDAFLKTGFTVYLFYILFL